MVPIWFLVLELAENILNFFYFAFFCNFATSLVLEELVEQIEAPPQSWVLSLSWLLHLLLLEIPNMLLILISS
jgi:hypothetical protein